MKKFFSLKGICDRFSSFAREGNLFFHWSIFLFSALLGTLILFRPAAGLRCCALLFLLSSLWGSVRVYCEAPLPYRHGAWGIFPLALVILFFSPHWDTAAFLFAELFLALTAVRFLQSESTACKIAGGAAVIAALTLLFQMFRCEWFDLYVGVALLFWGRALREIGVILSVPGKKSRT